MSLIRFCFTLFIRKALDKERVRKAHKLYTFFTVGESRFGKNENQNLQRKPVRGSAYAVLQRVGEDTTDSNPPPNPPKAANALKTSLVLRVFISGSIRLPSTGTSARLLPIP